MKNAQFTRFLLTCGVIAGPIYVVIGLAQMLTREGFDPTKHPLSLLSNGDLGWIQITNFIVSGLLVLAAAVGIKQVMKGERRKSLGAWFIGLYGLAVVAGGVFVADPSLGFPPGTPDVYAETFTWHGLLHFIAGQVAFLSLVIAAFVFGRHFAKTGVRRWAVFSRLTGAGFLVALALSMGSMGSDSSASVAAGTILLYVGVAWGWVWLTALAWRYRAKSAK